MIVPNYVVDQGIIEKEIKELNNILSQQRQLKKTLLLYLEKISEGIIKFILFLMKFKDVLIN